jgi:hypothetical protein
MRKLCMPTSPCCICQGATSKYLLLYVLVSFLLAQKDHGGSETLPILLPIT